MHILVIDDEEAIGLTLREFLQFEGYTAAIATDVQSALALAKEQTPDAILCDWQLPDGTGKDIIKQLPGIPIIIMSGNNQKTVGGENLHKIAGYIIKPFKTQTVLNAIKAAIKDRK